MNNSSYQVELDRFFSILFKHEIASRVLYKGNLTKARAKLDFEAFKELNDFMINHFYENFEHQTWHGFTLLAIDGSILRLPNEKPICDHFGGWSTNYGASMCPVARASQMFDVLNKVTVDAIISPKNQGERELAAYHLLKLQPKDLLLVDRGYPAHWFFKAVLGMDAQFCARISPEQSGVVKQFYQSKKSDEIVQLHPTLTSKRKCQELGFDADPIVVRLIRIEHDPKTVQVLVTSLIDSKAYPKSIFKDLYHKRWPVEEDYKALKFRLQVENFSGKTVHSVYQDFHAKVFSKNLTAVIATTTRKTIIEKSRHLKFIHQINFAQALARMKNTIILLFSCHRDKTIEYIRLLRKVFIQTTEPIKPNRKFPRINQIRRPRFFVCYKTTC